jgi:hypothetical protein
VIGAGHGRCGVVPECPLGTGHDRCEWHDGGTAGEDGSGGRWRRGFLDRSVGLLLCDHFKMASALGAYGSGEEPSQGFALTQGAGMVRYDYQRRSPIVVKRMIVADAPAKKTTKVTSSLNAEGLTRKPGRRSVLDNRSRVEE